MESIRMELEQRAYSEEHKKYLGFSKRQLSFLLTYGLYNIFRGALVLIAGPFYPPEAEERGISTSTMGFVFGAYDFATFLSSLFYGKYFIPKFGPHRVIIFSAFNTTICATLFGCLGFIKDKTTFLAFSFALRLIGGAGDAGFYPSAFTIFAFEFPELVSTTVGLFELFFGIGAILGPIACAPLIDSIGFEWTYISVGCCLLISSILIILVTPEPVKARTFYETDNVITQSSTQALEVTTTAAEPSVSGLFQLLKIPAIHYGVLSLFSTAASIGFITGTLEAHLEQFNLSSLEVGAIFTVSTVIYTICSPLWGQVADKLGLNKVAIIASGALLIAVGFVFLGPLDFISKESRLWTTLLGLGLHGVGIGPAIMVFFSYASEAAIADGFPDTTATYGLVSSIFTLTFSLGNAFGPAVSGTLYDAVGFKDATLVEIGLCCLVMLAASFLCMCTWKKRDSS